MNPLSNFTARKYLAIAALSVVLSLAIVRWHTQDSVPFCVNAAGCRANETLRGNVTTTTYGFPATYRQVEKFNPANTNPASGGYPGYKEAKAELQGFSLFYVITNFVFWFALLHFVARFIRPRKQAGPDVAGPAVPTPKAKAPEPSKTDAAAFH